MDEGEDECIEGDDEWIEGEGGSIEVEGGSIEVEGGGGLKSEFYKGGGAEGDCKDYWTL